MTHMKKWMLCLFAISAISFGRLSLAQTTQPTAASSAEPAAKPADAIALFDGTEKSLSDNWTYRDGKPVGWAVADGVATSKHMDIITKERYQDFTLHVEFNEPQMGPEVKGQARGNSGVYLQGRYEIQVLDSYGIAKPDKGDCGAIYNQKAPDENACLPPGQWQTYDITFKAAKFDENGKKIAKARVTVIQNGKKIQDDIEINGTTGSEYLKESAKPGPIMLQYHHNSVNFRNVWIVPGK
jgi:hypothetical protein